MQAHIHQASRPYNLELYNIHDAINQQNGCANICTQT